jgi:hypothetical protein
LQDTYLVRIKDQVYALQFLVKQAENLRWKVIAFSRGNRDAAPVFANFTKLPCKSFLPMYANHNLCQKDDESDFIWTIPLFINPVSVTYVCAEQKLLDRS